MSSEEGDRDWVITKFRSIVNPFLQDTELLKWKITEFWAASFSSKHRGKYPVPVNTIATTVNLIKDETPVVGWGNVMNNLMYEFIAKSSPTKMNMKGATALLRNNVKTKKGVIGMFSTGLGMRAWYITCGNWILCNADINIPRHGSTLLEWNDVFKGGGPESDIKMYWFTDGANVMAGDGPNVDSQIYPELLLFPLWPLLNWKSIPTQFL